jgi:protein-L-isoaspartate O-methyltransferase
MKISKILSSISPRLFFLLKVYRSLKHNDYYFVSTGYMKSTLLKKPVDNEGNVIPWMNYNIVNFLKERLKSDMSLFEFGSGYSTSFYSKYCSQVTSVEHDEDWFQKIYGNKPNNCDIIYIKYNQNLMGGDYSKTALNHNRRFNVIVVDGRDRVNCVKNSISALTPDGVLILDDSSREKYKPVFEFMLINGFRQITFCGLKSGERKESCTTIFYQDNNCFGI